MSTTPTRPFSGSPCRNSTACPTQHSRTCPCPRSAACLKTSKPESWTNARSASFLHACRRIAASGLCWPRRCTKPYCKTKPISAHMSPRWSNCRANQR
ncbi:hypothetical protein MCRY_05270 [Marivita cryptomonadis]|nr:hypothetical protein MCRY_05270 [Marivita cryptomonadis]